MSKLSRQERRILQGARDRRRRERNCPVEFATCGGCGYVIKVYQGEDGVTKPCPRCGWARHEMGGSWGWRALASLGQHLL